MSEKDKLKYTSHFEILPPSTNQKNQEAKNIRGNSVPEKNNKMQKDPVSNIITQEQQAKQLNLPHL